MYVCVRISMPQIQNQNVYYMLIWKQNLNSFVVTLVCTEANVSFVYMLIVINSLNKLIKKKFVIPFMCFVIVFVGVLSNRKKIAFYRANYT